MLARKTELVNSCNVQPPWFLQNCADGITVTNLPASDVLSAAHCDEVGNPIVPGTFLQFSVELMLEVWPFTR